MLEQGPTEPAPPPAVLPASWKRLDAWRYIHRSGLVVLVSRAVERDGLMWLHVSVSARGRLPKWDELVSVKEIFMGTTSTVLQVIPPRGQYVNDHPNVLHLWQCLDRDVTPDFRRRGTL
jgi:hypothetical protein